MADEGDDASLSGGGGLRGWPWRDRVQMPRPRSPPRTVLLCAAMSRRLVFVVGFASACCPGEAAKPAAKPVAAATDVRDLALPQEQHLANLHQLTFGADNAEAYWSFGGDRLIFQTNHKPYGCDQIEIMPATGGPAHLVSTGKGRTTCSYFLKGDQEIIYA